MPVSFTSTMLNSLLKLRYLFDREDKIQFAVLFVSIIVMAFLEVLGIASVLPFMKLVAEPEVIADNPWLQWVYEAGNFSSERTFMIAVGFAVLGLFASANAFAAFTIWLLLKCTWSMAHRVSVRLVTTYTRLPYEFFLTHNSADLIKKVVTEVSNLVSAVTAGCRFFAYTLVSIAIYALLLYVQPVVALAAFCLLGGLYGLIYVNRSLRLEQLGRERLSTNLTRYKTIVEVFSGIKTIQSSGVQDVFIRRFEAASECFSSVHLRFEILSLIPRYVIETLAFGGILVALLYTLMTGTGLITVLPTLSVFALAGYKLLPALNKAFTSISTLRHHLPVIDELCGEVEYHDAVGRSVGGSFVSRVGFKECISLDNVTFRYKTGQTSVLAGINVTIPRSSSVAFVGETGSGKTTLVDILVGLLPPREGCVRVDEVPITPDNVHQWRREIGYVPQEVFLVDDTVAANVAFGIEWDNLRRDRIIRVCQLAKIDEFILNKLPEGLATEIGERGVRLSGGQRQRIGLARALYRDPKVLILDEATSALDATTENEVIRNLQQQCPDLTLIIVAHRLSTVRSCERIYFLDGGSIVEEGSYAELFESNERFREMVELMSRQ